MTTDVRQVVIGIPSYDGTIHMGTVNCLLRDQIQLLSKNIILHFIMLSNGTYISHSRNDIVDQFLRHIDCSDLVFIDGDMEWEEGALLKLLSYNAAIVGGAYRRKNDNPDDYCVSFLDQNELWGNSENLIEVAGLPTGFLRIHRSVFEHQIKDLRVNMYKKHMSTRLQYNFFYQKQVNADFFGEDYMFCLDCREAGFKVFLAPELSIDHIGRQSYKGHVGNWLRNRVATKEASNGRQQESVPAMEVPQDNGAPNREERSA